MADSKIFEPSVKASKEDLFWLELGKNAINNTSNSYDEPAKQIINISGILLGLYFVAISFSTLKDQISVRCAWGCIFNLVFILPIILWLFGLYFAIRVLMPRFRSFISIFSPSEIKERWDEDIDYKSRNLIWAQRFLVWGFLPLIISICCYLIYFHSSSSGLTFSIK